MIALKTAAGWLDLLPGTIGLELLNPYFRFDAVPGISSYPFGLPQTPSNLRALNFPHVRAAQGELIAPEPVSFYLDGLLWSLGSLVYEEQQPAKGVLQYRFVAGASELQQRVAGLTFESLNLPAIPLELRHDHPDYALPTLKNADFYGDVNPGFGGLINAYQGGYLVNQPGDGNPYAVSPFPRLVPLLRAALATVGYSLSGPWLELPDAQQLCVYSDRAVDRLVDVNGGPLVNVFLPEISLSQHVPAGLSVGQVLVELQKHLAVGYDFLPRRRELRLRPLADVARNPAYRDRAPGSVPTRHLPPAGTGFTLEMGLENDELAKVQDTSWKKLVVGAGKEVIQTESGTLLVVDEPNGWQLPAVQGRGATPEPLWAELGNDSRCGLRLLFDRGLQPGRFGGQYPLATPLATNAQGQAVGEWELRWGGPQGLYAQCHQPWLALLDGAGTVERQMPFHIGDLLTLDPAEKELVESRKYVWEKISLSVSTSKRLESARFTYKSVRL